MSFGYGDEIEDDLIAAVKKQVEVSGIGIRTIQTHLQMM